MGLGSNKSIPIQIPRSLNVRAHPFRLGPSRTPDCVNVEFSQDSIRVRDGEVSAIDKTYNNITAGLRNSHRYVTDEGTKKTFFNSNGSVIADSDNNEYDAIASMTQSDGLWIDFAQYRNTLFGASDADDMMIYNALGTPTTIAPELGIFETGPSNGVIPNDGGTNTGGFLLDKRYVWRVTFDISIGADFLGETGASKWSTGQGLYEYKAIDWTAETGDDNTIDFVRPADAQVDAWPDYLTAINFYRSAPLDDFSSLGYEYLEDQDLFYIGSVDMTTVKGLSAGANIFTDDGTVAGGKGIPYGIYKFLPQPRFIEFFKGRLFGANVGVKEDTDSSYTVYPNDIIYSKFFENGEEPVIFQKAAPRITIDKYEGEGITGLRALDYDRLMVWKPNSTHAIFGGDSFISATIPTFQRKVISNNVGCIAPYSIVIINGVAIWLSNEGVVYYDGSDVRPLPGNDEIQPLLDSIPAARRRLAHAVWDSIDHKYELFFSDIDNYEYYNRDSLCWWQRTQSWTRNQYKRGIGTAIELKENDQQVKLLFGRDDIAALFDGKGDPIITEAHNGTLVGLQTLVNTGVPWRCAIRYEDNGDGTVDKAVDEVMVEGEWYDAPTVGFRVDGRVDTTASPITMGVPEGNRGLSKKPATNNGLRGKRIQFVLAGQTDTGTAEITALYTQKRGEGRTER